MIKRPSALTIILIILAVYFAYSIGQIFTDMMELQKIKVAWVIFVGAEYNINRLINGVNQGNGLLDVVDRFNVELQEIDDAEKMLEPIYGGSDELIYIKGFKRNLILIKRELEQAMVKPDPKYILRTSETQDEIEVETANDIEETDLGRKLYIHIITTIILTFMFILSWRIDNLIKTK